MIIWIDKNNEVVSVAQGVLEELAEVDNVKSFCVDALTVCGKSETLHFDPETRSFYTKARVLENPLKLEEITKRAALRRQAERARDAVLKWFSDNDWKVNKHLLGEWSDTDERWLAYLAGREKARAEYDEAEATLTALAERT